MHKPTPSYILSIKQYLRITVACIAGIIGLLLMSAPGGVLPAYADGVPGGNIADPVVRAVDIAKPAVVRILTQVDGQLTVNFAAGKSATFPQNGSNGYPLLLSGTGAFISAHGDILTADHVVNPPRADLDAFLQQTAASDVATYINQNLKPTTPVTADQVAQALASGQLNSTPQYATPTSRVYLSTDFSGALPAGTGNNIPSSQFADVDQIKQQSSFNQNDVAIIHVSGMDNLAMVQLGDSAAVQQQDTLTIIGFPGNGDVNQTNPTDLLSLSINKVFVSAVNKTTDSGAPVIQVGGNVEHGDSGGPALDNNGNVVGVVSFSTSNTGSTSFLQASSSAKQLIQAGNIDTTESSFQKAWAQAFGYYAATTAGHWHQAQQGFQQMANQYPQFKAVQPFLQYATQQAQSEKAPQTTPTTPGFSTSTVLSNPWLLVGVGGGILVLALLVGVGVIAARRRKPAPATPAAAASMPSTMARPYSYPMPAQPGVGNPPAMPSTPAPAPSAQPAYQQRYDSMGAFGAPTIPAPRPAGPPAPASAPSWQNRPAPPQVYPGSGPGMPSNPAMPANNNSGVLVPWPCGHMNRAGARYCTICGEPAPPPPTVRRYEQ